MKRFYLLLISFLLFAISPLNSQFPRKVIVEEATNASCGPCASQNPIFQKWLNNHLDRVIPIIYHAWWPGPNDPMYKYDTIMNQIRIKYYGINGVPSGRLNGLIAPSSGSYYAGAVADTIALNNLLNSVPFYSMLSIEIKEFTYDNNGNGIVKIDVTSLKSISNVYLRVVICEEHHYYSNAGSNGEKDFYWVARKMLPNATGTLLNLNENETSSFEFSFNVDTSFIDDLYAVAFIQDDKTKEILQGDWTKNYPFKLPDYSLFVFGTNFVDVAQTDDEFEIEGIILNNTSKSQTFTIDLEGKDNLPQDWVAGIVNNTTQVVVEPKSKFNFTARLKVGQTKFASDLRIKIETLDGKFSETSSNWKIYHSGIERLNILAGEKEHSIQTIFDQKFGKGHIFEITENDFSNLSSRFNALKTIVWNGSTTGEFTASSANLILDAINRNKNILICGGRITSGMVSNGVLPYFGVSFIAFCREGFGQAPYSVKLAGVPNDPITGDFGNSIQGYLINYLLPLYKIVNSSTTSPIMTFAKSADSICAVKVQWTKNRAIILGMNPYVIYDENIRNTLLYRSLLWLEGQLSDVTFDFGNGDEFTLGPNPTSSYTYLNFSLQSPVEHCKIEIIDLYGRVVRTILDGSIFSIGQISIPINLVGLPAQTLFLKVNLNNIEKIFPIIKIN